MKKIYRGILSSDKNDEPKVEGKPTLAEKSDLVYRGVSENTTYYQLSKIRSSHRKRKLFHSGLEIFGQRKYLY